MNLFQENSNRWMVIFAVSTSLLSSFAFASYVPPTVNRRTDQIVLREKRTEKDLPWGAKSQQLDFYRNGAYECGLTGHYTFLVVNPSDGNASTQAPLWVYLHGGASGYFDSATGAYRAKKAHQSQDTHNHEETLDRMWGGTTNPWTGEYQPGTVLSRTTTTTTQGSTSSIDSTLTRRLREGYRLLVVSMCDHDSYSGLGTIYPHNPNGPNKQVNGLQANMAAIDFTQANYPTTHTVAHGTSAGSLGVWPLASSYGAEGKGQLQAIVADSGFVTPRALAIYESTLLSPNVMVDDYDYFQYMDKVGHYWQFEDFPSYPEAQISQGDFRAVPALFLVGNEDPGLGGGGDIEPVPEVDEVPGVRTNPEYIAHGLAEAIATQDDSPHELHILPKTGHVPTNRQAASLCVLDANDVVDGFLAKVLGMPTPPSASICGAKLFDLCGDNVGEDDDSMFGSCGKCARSYQAELVEARCTVPLVTEICKRLQTAGNGSNKLPCLPESTQTCASELSKNCPTAEFSSLSQCGTCAQTQRATLESAGCTVPIVTALCKLRENADSNDSSDDYDDDAYGNGNNVFPVPETVLPTGATKSNPLKIFISAGQSGCVGQASAPMMNQDSNPSYDELKGTQDGVWFSGLQTAKFLDPSRFYMGPMVAGEASKNGQMFGVEVSMGKRLFEAEKSSGNEDSKSPVLVIKYCWGGSNAHTQWNPGSIANSWDRQRDDGTAEWLLTESGGAVDLANKNHLYANMIYVVRRSLEVLENGGIPYALSGFFWLQGSSDKLRTWKEYGDDLVNLFQAIRTDLGEASLPIVDSGTVHHNIQTGKEYAGSIIDGCNHVRVTKMVGAPNPDDDCIVGPTNPCLESTFFHWDVFDYYGYDPLMNTPEYSSIIPADASNKTFHWFKKFPHNLHAEYDGKILQGRMMANAYIRSFTSNRDYELKEEWLLDDIHEQFPYEPCDPTINGGKPSESLICWMDLREEADLAQARCPSSLDSMGGISISRRERHGASDGSKPISLVSWSLLLTMVLSLLFL